MIFGKAIAYFPLDKVRTEDILDRSGDFGAEPARLWHQTAGFPLARE